VSHSGNYLPSWRCGNIFIKYLYRQELHLCTDHSALTWLMGFENLKGHTSHWIQRLQEYNFSSEHCLGQKHNGANALFMSAMLRMLYPLPQSWSPGRCQTGTSYCNCSHSQLEPATLRTERLNDQDLGPILEKIETGNLPGWKDIPSRSPAYKSYLDQWNSLAVRNGILERHWKYASRQPKIAQIILRRNRVNGVLTELHGVLSGGYMGVSKTLDKVRQR
jgi:hypothetical protein